MDNSQGQSTDALGGAILVDNGGVLSLTNSVITGNTARAPAGAQVVGQTYSGRQGAGYNAAGGGIYGSAGSNISVDATSVISNNYVLAGKGGNVSDSSIGHGGNGGNAFGAGIAINAPASDGAVTTTEIPTVLNLDGGAAFNSNVINQGTTNSVVINEGGTGGAYTGGAGGTGGSASGAGLYMASGQLNLNGLGNTAVHFNNNYAVPGSGYVSGVSGVYSGANGVAAGAGAYISPGQLIVSNTTSSGGILHFSNDTIAGGAASSLFFPAVTTQADTGYTTPNGPWNLRAALFAANPLAASGMEITLNLEPGTLSLSAGSGTDSGSLVIANSIPSGGALRLIGSSQSPSIISAASTTGPSGQLATSIFAVSNARVKFKDLTIEGAQSTTNGGALSLINSDVTLTTATLTQNQSPNGGGIYQSQGTLTLLDSMITSNITNGSGGGLFLDAGCTTDINGNSQITSNSAASLGGGIYAYFSNMSLAAMTLNLNHAQSGGGVFQSGDVLNISGSTLTGNYSTTGYGGALLVNAGCTLTVSGGFVKGNYSTASNGGGIAESGAAVHLTAGVSVSGNTALGAGGAGGGLFQSGGTVTLNNAVVQKNKAIQGGGILSDGGTLTVKHSNLTGNSAQGTGAGGGIFAEGNAAVHLSTATLISNLASMTQGFGGGIYQSSGTLTTISAVIKNNSAWQGGGGYFTGSTVSMMGGKVNGNYATTNGGGLLSWNNTLDLSGVSVLSNHLSTGGVTSGQGGGLYQNAGGHLKLNNGTLVKNNSAANGGGVFCDSSLFTDHGAAIIGNTAIYQGGGFCSWSNSNAMDFTNAKVSSNHINAVGAASGGGLYIANGTINTDGINVQYNQIQAANNQTIQGGGLCVISGNINLNGGSDVIAVFNGNVLTGNGGGTGYGGTISLTTGSLDDNSKFTFINNVIKNTANGVGGGVAFFQNTSYNSSCYTTANGNSADAGGNDYAFTVSNTSDANYNSSLNGPTSLNDFTSGSGSLRSAINYAENYMNGNSNNHSMAIMMSPATYTISPTYWQLVTSINDGNSLSLIAENGQASITADGQCRDFSITNAGTLSLQNLLITGGYNNFAGGGIYMNSGTLTLNGTTVSGNYAGEGGTASNNFDDGKNTQTWNYAGSTGASGASGYGGGIYMGNGTLNLLPNAYVSGNTVQGQNGAQGQKGGAGSASKTYWGACQHKDAGNGGSGGNGGNALGGGIYQAGGTIRSTVGVNDVQNNTAIPGVGGAGGYGGNGADDSGCKASSGATGSTGSSGNGRTNYTRAAGGTVFTSNSTISAQAVGGLYQAAGTLSGIQAQAAGGPNRLADITLELHAADGTLITTSKTDKTGVYRFKTTFSGMGYVQFVGVPVFDVVAKGTIVGQGVPSAIDPSTLKSDVVEFMAGVPVDKGLSFALEPIKTDFRIAGNSLIQTRGDGGPVLWTTQLMPRNYNAGFTATSYDLNGDHTDDFVLMTRSGTPRAFLVDGRTGKTQAIAGTVPAGLRSGMVAQEETVLGSETKQLLLMPSGGRSGPMALIDLNSARVMWKTNNSVSGGMSVSFVGSGIGDPLGNIDVSVASVKSPWLRRIYSGQTGRIVFNDRGKPPRISASSVHVNMIHALEHVTRPHQSAAIHHNSAIMHRAVKFKR